MHYDAKAAPVNPRAEQTRQRGPSNRTLAYHRTLFLVTESTLSDGAKVLMLRIAAHCGYGRSECWATIETLARECHCSTRTIGRRLLQLEQSGWITPLRKSESKFSHRVLILGPVLQVHLDTVSNAPRQSAANRPGPPQYSEEKTKEKARSVDPGGGNPGTDQAELARIKADVEIPSKAEIPALAAQARQPGPAGLPFRLMLHGLVTSGQIPAEWVDADVLVLAPSDRPGQPASVRLTSSRAATSAIAAAGAT
jgi:hypothetical protein